MSVSAARSLLMIVKERLDMNRLDDVELTLAAAEECLVHVREQDADEKAALLAEIAWTRTALAARTPEHAPAPSTAPLSEADERLLSRAKSQLVWARSNIETRRYDDVDRNLQQALEQVAGLADGPTAELRREVEQIRVAAAAARQAEAEATLASRANREIRNAREMIDRNYPRDDVLAALDRIKQYLLDLRDHVRIPLFDEINEVRALLGAAPADTPAPTPAPAPAVAAVPPAGPGGAVAPLSGADQASLARANSQLRWARSNIESRRYDEVDRNLQQALELVAGAADEHTAELRREVEQLRLEVQTAKAAEERATLISQATTRLRSVRSDAEIPRRTQQVAMRLEQVRELIAPLPDEDKGDMLREIEEIRAQAIEAEQALRFGALERALQGELGLVESIKGHDFGQSRQALARFHERIGRDDMADLPRSRKDRLLARAADLTAEVDRNHKADALSRAESRMRDLAEQLASDPFVGRRDDEVHSTSVTVQHYRNQVLEYLGRVPEPDADVQAVRDRLTVLDETLAGYDRSWVEAKAQERVTGSWNRIAESNAGWEQEAIDTAPPSLYSPSVDRTRDAMLDAMRFRADAEVRRIRDEYPDDAAIQNAWRASGELFEATAAKVNAAFVRSLDHFDAKPAPMIKDELDQTMHLSSAADNLLEGTPYHDAVIGRIKALDARWRQEYAAMLEERQRLYDKLAGEADARWPAIVAASGADTLDPWNPTQGQLVLLSGVYNRCGWDWSGREYGFAAKYQGVVLGGIWEPHVLRALEHAWYELKLDVSDRITWDVIAIVRGPAKIGERSRTVVRDVSSGQERTIEQWPAVECLLLQIVGLHAGPVAIGPEER